MEATIKSENETDNQDNGTEVSVEIKPTSQRIQSIYSNLKKRLSLNVYAKTKARYNSEGREKAPLPKIRDVLKKIGHDLHCKIYNLFKKRAYLIWRGCSSDKLARNERRLWNEFLAITVLISEKELQVYRRHIQRKINQQFFKDLKARGL